METIENSEKKNSIYDEKTKLWSSPTRIINENHTKSMYTNEYGQKILKKLLENGSGVAQVRYLEDFY